MRKLIYIGGLALIMFFFGCTNREPGSFTITGEMKGLPDGKVKIYSDYPSNCLLDSCEIKDGKYFLKGKLESSQLGMLYFEVKPGFRKKFLPLLRIFLEPSDIRVNSDVEDVKGSTKIENSHLNDEWMMCENFLKSLPEYEKALALTDEIQLACMEADMVRVRTLSEVRDSLHLLLIDKLFGWKKDAAKNEAVAYLANQYAAPLSGDKVLTIVERFAPDFRTSYYVSQMEKFASKEQHLLTGKLFPDFQVFDKNEHKYSLSDFQGKYLFIEFSASWCCWCKKELPYIRKAYDQLKDQNIVFITMMMDTDRERWLTDMEKEGFEWLCLTDLRGMKKSPMVESYNLRGLPDSFVVDPQGYILRRDLRGNEVLEYLSSLCNK
ncbi:MAG: TlpA disulfide reductase family protein [Odoribacter sp.]